MKPKKNTGRYKKLLASYVQAIKKIPFTIGRDAFLFILIFILIDILFGEFLFYQYVFLVESKKQEIDSGRMIFKESTYDSVLGQWKIREDIFNDASKQNHQDPFQK